MIKGPGRSACFKGGVTYGYRECLRKGRIRQKLRRKFAGPSWTDGLAKSFLSAKCRPRAFCSPPPLMPRKTVSRCFFRDRISRKLRVND